MTEPENKYQPPHCCRSEWSARTPLDYFAFASMIGVMLLLLYLVRLAALGQWG